MLYWIIGPLPAPAANPMYWRPTALCSLALLAPSVLGACFGGQSGDEGLDYRDDTRATSEAAIVCLGASPAGADAGADAGYRCTPAADAGAGFDCSCAGELGHSEAASCEDALREHCGVEPLDEPPEQVPRKL